LSSWRILVDLDNGRSPKRQRQSKTEQEQKRGRGRQLCDLAVKEVPVSGSELSRRFEMAKSLVNISVGRVERR